MALLCPACKAELADGSRFCRQCGARLEPGRARVGPAVAVMSARVFILLTLVVNIVGWVVCFNQIDYAIELGLLNGVLGLLLFVVGLIARYPWAWSLGLAHFALPWFMFEMVRLHRMGPLQARPAFIWADAVFLAVVLPLSLVGCYLGAKRRPFLEPGLCRMCGYPLHGLAGPRCPECGTPFDPELLAGQAPSQEGPAAGS
jgi:hypothetical protein